MKETEAVEFKKSTAEVKTEDFFSGLEQSILRNPLIAETMYKSKDIERWGSGIKRVHDECVAAGIRVEFRCGSLMIVWKCGTPDFCCRL